MRPPALWLGRFKLIPFCTLRIHLSLQAEIDKAKVSRKKKSNPGELLALSWPPTQLHIGEGVWG